MGKTEKEKGRNEGREQTKQDRQSEIKESEKERA